MEYHYSIEIIVLCILVLIFYKLFGKYAIMIVAFLAIVYLYWFSREKKSLFEKSKFITSDAQLTEAIEVLRRESAKGYSFDFNQIHSSIEDFIEIYVSCFMNETVVKNKFHDLTSLRRSILNHILSIHQDTSLMAEVTWKYIKALIMKYDLNYSYPIASNEFGVWDVY